MKLGTGFNCIGRLWRFSASAGLLALELALADWTWVFPGSDLDVWIVDGIVVFLSFHPRSSEEFLVQQLDWD